MDNGTVYGMKSASFGDYFCFPQKTGDRFELAIGSATAPRTALGEAGWHIADPLAVTRTADTYQEYIRQSKGEWSIAKQGYVSAYSGWFSERSAGYLASGRPVIVQDTGFSIFLETGRGLFSFNTPGEAAAAVEEVNRDYAAHCRYARAIAEEYFRYDKVLSAMLHRCSLTMPVS
jgi:hypothetical protein